MGAAVSPTQVLFLSVSGSALLLGAMFLGWTIRDMRARVELDELRERAARQRARWPVHPRSPYAGAPYGFNDHLVPKNRTPHPFTPPEGEPCE